MKKEHIVLPKVTHYLIIISFLVALMYFAADILIPLVIAMYLSLLLYPACKFMEKKLPRILSIILTYVAVFIIISGIIFFFSSQFLHLFENIKNFGQNLNALINKFFRIIDNNFLHGSFKIEQFLGNNPAGFIESNRIIQKTIVSSSNIVISFGLVMVYTFLFLLYRTSFKNLFIYLLHAKDREYGKKILKSIQKVAQKYFFGLMIVIFIVGSLSGFGLWIIGLDYPFLFGYFGALLAIIPYIGTFIGGLIPVLYALINYNNIWTAVFVLGWYIFVHAIEGNILTPKIVGSQVSLNPLIALIAIITGALIWGIPGMVLFIPSMAILKVVFDHIESLKPYALLLSSDFGNKKTRLFRNPGKKGNNKQKESNQDKPNKK